MKTKDDKFCAFVLLFIPMMIVMTGALLLVVQKLKLYRKKDFFDDRFSICAAYEKEEARKLLAVTFSLSYMYTNHFLNSFAVLTNYICP